MKALVGAFNQEKALVGAFSVIVKLHRLIDLRHYYRRTDPVHNRDSCNNTALYGSQYNDDDPFTVNIQL